MQVWSSPVRYAECDQQGIVFNAHYLVWADEGCTAWLADDYPGMLARGLDMRVKTSTLTWSAPVRWGEVVEVHVRAVEVGRTSFTVPMTVRVAGEDRCEVRTTYVLVDDEGVPTPVPDDLRERWTLRR
ncbi:MAG: putative thioesterase [Frankiales bacterium]|nr:putative thioesterase [Frankiales bacterium]